MAVQDWDLPILATAYATYLSTMKGRDVDSATMVVPTNPPVNMKVWDVGDNTFKNFDDPAWTDLILGVAGGGTGSATGAGARTNLGLGTIATQDANAVAITGGTVVDVTLTATVDDTEYIGSNTFKFAKLYLASGLLIPVGADKYLSS